VEAYCLEQGIDVVARIPFDTRVTEAQVQGISIVEYTDDGRLTGPIEDAWSAVSARLEAV
jgi:MinD superfamily P-loop ATPase